MPANIEIKARVNDRLRFHRTAKDLSSSQATIQQEDTFFRCPYGRLKLRSFPDGTGELIHYDRPDGAGPKVSRYSISRTDEPDSLRDTLSRALGIVGIVRKIRHLFVVGQTRVHLDEVEGLGTFAELEVVMQPGQTWEKGKSIAADLMKKLNICEADLIDGAYIDLLAAREANTK